VATKKELVVFVFDLVAVLVVVLQGVGGRFFGRGRKKKWRRRWSEERGVKREVQLVPSKEKRKGDECPT